MAGPEHEPQPMRAARKGARAELPKRFYKDAAAVPVEGGFGIRLDGKPVRTPGKAPVVVPTEAIAQVLAAEWRALADVIDPRHMPMTRLVNSAIDGVTGKEAEVAADIASYAGSDLLCYRADFPEALVARQQALWDPVLTWVETTFSAPMRTCVGVMHVAQPEASVARIAAAIGTGGVFRLAGLHSMTTLTGSVLLALAVERGHLTPAAAWTAAHVDEDFQISQWGEDAEAQQRRTYRWADMQAAAQLATA